MLQHAVFGRFSSISHLIMFLAANQRKGCKLKLSRGFKRWLKIKVSRLKVGSWNLGWAWASYSFLLDCWRSYFTHFMGSLLCIVYFVFQEVYKCLKLFGEKRGTFSIMLNGFNKKSDWNRRSALIEMLSIKKSYFYVNASFFLLVYFYWYIFFISR